jgi:TolA-binding protein
MLTWNQPGPRGFGPRRAAVCLLYLASCASTGASAADVEALREEVAVLRRDNARDEKRIEALENQVDIQEADLRKLRPRDGTASLDLPPDLKTVRLASPTARAVRSLPVLPTAVPVREPDRDALANLDTVSLSTPVRAPGRGDPSDPDVLYNAAFEKLKTGDLVGAANDFQLFAQRFPHHTAADNALLDEGIALYGLRRYAEALQVLARIERNYPAGDTVPEALWRSADCQERLSHPKEARAVLEHLSQKYPNSPEGQKAHARLAEAHGTADAEKGVSP